MDNRPQWIKAFQEKTYDRLLLLFLICLTLIGLASIGNPLKRGLLVSYYDNPEWQETPIAVARERAINLRRKDQVFPSLTRDYSIRWEGVLYVPKAGDYQFTLVSDDGSSLFLDQHLLIDNGGFHVKQERTGQRHLEKGFHSIQVNYMQGKGMAIFRVYWTPPGQQQEPLSRATFFAETPGRKAFLFGRGLEILSSISTICCLLCVASACVIRLKRDLPALARLHTAHICAGIFLIVFVSHFFWSDITTPFDSKWSVHTALSLIREGNTDLNEYAPLVQTNQDHTLEHRNDHTYTIYPIGTSLLAVPYIFLVDAFMQSGFFIDFEQFINQYTLFPAGIEKFAAANIVSLAAVVMYLTGRLLLQKRTYALLLTFIFAFCTSAWSSASRALWQHGPSILVLAISLYLLLRAEKSAHVTPWAIRLVSLPLAFSYVIRPTNSLSLFVFTLVIFIRYRKHFLGYCLWSLVVLIPFVLYNLHVYQAPLSPYYLPGRQFGSLDLVFLKALAGTLLSPSRGLFIFSPVLLFSLYGILIKCRAKQMKLLDYALVFILILHWFVSSLHPHWWGGHSYGPRYFSDILPYLLYFLVPAFLRLADLRGIKKFAVICLLVCAVTISFFIHYRGATSEDVYAWNAGPVNVDSDPSRVWDWHDIQFLRGL